MGKKISRSDGITRGHRILSDIFRLVPSIPYSIFCLAVCCFSVVAQTNPDQVLSEALQAHQAGNLEKAARAYEDFLALRPERADIRSNLGAVLSKLGRYQEAIEQYLRALKLDQSNNAIRFNLALAYYKSEQIPAAAGELARVVSAQPDNKNATLLLADCYLQMGEDKKVIELLEPKARIQSDDLTFAYLLGNALIHVNQVEKGQVYIDKILRHGDSAQARMLIGSAHLAMFEYKDAVKEFAEAVKLDPQLTSLHSYYGLALMMIGEAERAKEEFIKELEINPNDFDANLQLGLLLKKDQNGDEALKYFRRALKVRPSEPNARFYVATLQVYQGQMTEALADLEKLVKDTPDFVEAHVMLATVYYRLKRKADGDREQAIINKLNAERQANQPGSQVKQ
jgi:tetratricopeptide (TPR) repeat protein